MANPDSFADTSPIIPDGTHPILFVPGISDRSGNARSPLACKVLVPTPEPAESQGDDIEQGSNVEIAKDALRKWGFVIIGANAKQTPKTHTEFENALIGSYVELTIANGIATSMAGGNRHGNASGAIKLNMAAALLGPQRTEPDNMGSIFSLFSYHSGHLGVPTESMVPASAAHLDLVQTPHKPVTPESTPILEPMHRGYPESDYYNALARIADIMGKDFVNERTSL